MSQDAVSRFLLEEYGYGRISDVLRKHKETGVSLSQIGSFFGGTIIGTYKAFGTDMENPGIWRSNYKPKSSRFLGIPKVWTTEESVKKYGSGGFRIEKLPYHMRSWNFLDGYGRDDVERFLNEKVATSFTVPEITSKKGEKKSQTWEYQLKSENFGFYVTGSSRPNTKTIIIDFNSKEEFKDHLDRIVNDYWEFVNQLKAK